MQNSNNKNPKRNQIIITIIEFSYFCFSIQKFNNALILSVTILLSRICKRIKSLSTTSLSGLIQDKPIEIRFDGINQHSS